MMKRGKRKKMGIGNIVGMIGAVLALLGMFAPGLEAWGMVEISWYDLAADFGGLMGGGMLENIIMILIFIGTGILMYKGQCAAGLLIAVVTMLYFFANFVMASEIIRGDVMGWGQRLLGQVWRKGSPTLSFQRRWPNITGTGTVFS